MIWFTSDTHFGHANVLHFTDRPFGDIAHMNRALSLIHISEPTRPY